MKFLLKVSIIKMNTTNTGDKLNHTKNIWMDTIQDLKIVAILLLMVAIFMYFYPPVDGRIYMGF